MGRAEALFSSSKIRAIALMVLLLTSVLPLFASPVVADGRDASITVQAIPTSLEVNPGEAGEYTIRVYNTGSDPITVSLSTNEEATQECNAYNSVIQQISGQIESNSYEETTLNVSLTQVAEGSCDTTITANAQLVPPAVGSPAQESVTVTTTAGDGSGSALFGIDVIINNPDKNWNGEESIDYTIELENTGLSDANVNLALNDGTGPGCGSSSDITVTLSETTLTVGSDDTEIVTATVETPDGQAADKYCWEVEAVVTNDPSQEATDSEEFSLTVPELHTCDVVLSKNSVSVDPGKKGTFKATFSNTGNDDWTLTAGGVGAKAAWVGMDDGQAASGLLEYDNGNGQRVVNMIVTPDDSVNAGSETVVNIVGKEGNSVKCSADIRIIVGQSKGASISASTTLLPNIEPGSSKTLTVTIQNEGNGMDTLRVASSAPPSGWSVRLSESTVSVGSKHGSDDTASVDVTVDVPLDALASDEFPITINVLPSSGGAAYDSVTFSVTVAEFHAMEATALSTDQTGRSSTEVRFPIEVENQGNVQDTMRFAMMSQTASPAWGTHFETESGSPFTEIDIAPKSTLTVYFVVSIDGEEELENSRFTVRITNKDDPNSADDDGDGLPDNQREFSFRAILSNRNFAMDIRFDQPDLSPRSKSILLPPDGTMTMGLWIRNTGDGADKAVISMTGLEGIATRTVSMYGLPVEQEFDVPIGFGMWNLSSSSFEIDPTGEPITAPSQAGIENKMFEQGKVEGYQARPYEIYVELVLRVSPGAEKGEGGLLNLVVTSVSNAANRSGALSVALEVNIIHELSMEVAGFDPKELDITYGERSTYEVMIHNTGNIRSEYRIFTSENLRGWSVVLEGPSEDCSIENGDLLCWVEAGESIPIEVSIRPPYQSEIDDIYKFTLSAEPVELEEIGRENIEFKVSGTSADNLLGLDDRTTLSIVGSVVLLVLLGALLMRRR
jgi:uncharacterized membrane protein